MHGYIWRVVILRYLQSDVAYRKQWDKLVIKVDVIDADDLTGCDVVHWVTHYPVCEPGGGGEGKGGEATSH